MKRFEIVTPKTVGYLSWIMLGHLALAFLIYQQEWSLLLISLGLYYIISQVGISFTFHKILSHKAAKVPFWLEFVGSIIGGFAMQGSPLSWAIVHRTHHKYSGTPKDPTSTSNLGSWYIHCFGYVFSKFDVRLGVDLFKTWQGKLHRYYYPIYGTILIGSLFVLDFNVALALFWAPISLTFNFENFINTWAHDWDRDIPIDSVPLRIFLIGEAYHKAHHDNPSMMRFGKYDLMGYLGEKFLK